MRMLINTLVMLFAVALIAWALTAQAAEISGDAGAGRKSDKSRKIDRRDTRDSRTSIEVRVDLAAQVRAELAAEERAGRTGGCRLLSRPVLPRDVGLGTSVRTGVYDPILAQVIDQSARSAAAVGDLADEGRIRTAARCAAWTGAVIATAVQAVQSAGPGSPADVRTLVGPAVKLALQSWPRSIRDTYDRAAHDAATAPCRFVGGPDRIACGAVELTLSAPARATCAGVELLGAASYGVTGSVTVAAGSSRASERVLSLAQGWDRTSRAGGSMSPGKLVPTPQ